MPLRMLMLGKYALVTDVSVEKKLRHRLSTMGIFKGSKIKVINKTSCGMIVESYNTKLAVSNEIVEFISVTN